MVTTLEAKESCLNCKNQPICTLYVNFDKAIQDLIGKPLSQSDLFESEQGIYSAISEACSYQSCGATK